MLLATPLLRAQTNQPTVAFPTGNAAWTVNITYHDKGTGSSTQPNPMTVEAVRADEIIHYHTIWTNNRSTDDWLTKDFIFFQDVNTGHISPMQKGGSVFEYYGYDNARFDWVNSGEVVSPRESYQGKICLHVRKGRREEPNTDARSQSSPIMQAWIDSQTHLPVAFDDGHALYAYTFLPAPKDPLVLPQSYQDLKDRFTKARSEPKVLGR